MIWLARFVFALFVIAQATSIAEAQFENGNATWGFRGTSKAAFADFNNDGWVDVYSGILLKNEGGKKFAVLESGIPSGEGIWGDYNNDGFVDLFLFTGSGSLFKNIDGKKFEQVEFPELPTVSSRSAVWIDINNDAYLDLYVGGYETWTKAVHPDVIYLNDGKGRFEELWRQQDCYSARGVTSADFDADGKSEVFVSNYRLQPNFLMEFGENRLPVNIANELAAGGNGSGNVDYTGGISYPICGHTIGSCFGDLDNDGWIDLLVGNFSHPPKIQNRTQFLKNLGPTSNYKFQDKSSLAKLAWQESYASPTLGDFDNDGNLDLFFTTVYATGSGGIKNYPVLYRNNGDWKFEDVTEQHKLSGIGPTYQAAWADIDNDGDLDLCSAGTIYVNNTDAKNWIKIRLVGDGKSTNRSAIGAIVRIKVGKKTLTRHVETATGEGNQNDPVLHFGLGQHDRPVNLEILWPGKVQQTVKGLQPGRSHVIKFSKQSIDSIDGR